MSRNELFADIHNPRLSDLVGTDTIVSEPVVTTHEPPSLSQGVIVAHPDDDIDPCVIDPIEGMLAAGIRVGHANRIHRRHR